MMSRICSKILQRDFPGGPVVKNPPANTEDTGSIPGPGRSHTPCNYWAAASEARGPRAQAPQEKPPQWEVRAPQQRVAPAFCS